MGCSRGKRRTRTLFSLGKSAPWRSRCRDQAKGLRAVEGTHARPCRRYHLDGANDDGSRAAICFARGAGPGMGGAMGLVWLLLLILLILGTAALIKYLGGKSGK